MKKIILLLLISLTCFSCGQRGQENIAKTPGPVIIANDEFITMERLNELVERGYVKVLFNGVSEEERERLFELFGNKIPPKELIKYIELFTEEELEKKKNEPESAIKTSPTSDWFLDKFYVLRVNDTAKDFTVQMINGETITLSNLKGQVVLLDFWATWCGPCIREFYVFPKIIESFKKAPFVVLPISIDDTEEIVKNVMAQLKEKGIDFNVGVDSDKSIYKLYLKGGGVPHKFLIDKNGIIRYIPKSLTAFDPSSKRYVEHSEHLNNLTAMIKKLLEE
ncbi:MAG: TlpA family protein disulfide reductase [Bacteroidales bacterium]|nr:TlpA family protein disulfide reductase [Bacteroidales bacterium]